MPGLGVVGNSLFFVGHFLNKPIEKCQMKLYNKMVIVYKKQGNDIFHGLRGQGIGSQLMVKMLELLKWQGYERASLAVQKANYAVKMYKDVGFKTVDENAEEYIMVCEL